MAYGSGGAGVAPGLGNAPVAFPGALTGILAETETGVSGDAGGIS